MSNQLEINSGEKPAVLPLSSGAPISHFEPTNTNDNVLGTHHSVEVPKPGVGDLLSAPAHKPEINPPSTSSISVPTSIQAKEKKDGSEGIAKKTENGISSADVPNGTLRSKSKSPGPALTFAPEKPVEKKNDHSDSAVPAAAAAVVTSPDGAVTIVPETKPAEPGPAVVTRSDEPEATTTTKPVETTTSLSVSKPAEPAVPTAVANPSVSAHSVPTPVASETTVPAVATNPTVKKDSAAPGKQGQTKKPEPKPKAPKKQKAPKRAATETGEPRRSKRNKPDSQNAPDAF